MPIHRKIHHLSRPAKRGFELFLKRLLAANPLLPFSLFLLAIGVTAGLVLTLNSTELRQQAAYAGCIAPAVQIVGGVDDGGCRCPDGRVVNPDTPCASPTSIVQRPSSTPFCIEDGQIVGYGGVCCSGRTYQNGNNVLCGSPFTSTCLGSCVQTTAASCEQINRYPATGSCNVGNGICCGGSMAFSPTPTLSTGTGGVSACTQYCLTASSCGALGRVSAEGVCPSAGDVCCGEASSQTTPALQCVPNSCANGKWCGSDGVITVNRCNSSTQRCDTVISGVCFAFTPTPTITNTPISYPCSLQTGTVIDRNLNTYCCDGKISYGACIQSSLSAVGQSCQSINNCQTGLICSGGRCVDCVANTCVNGKWCGGDNRLTPITCTAGQTTCESFSMGKCLDFTPTPLPYQCKAGTYRCDNNTEHYCYGGGETSVSCGTGGCGEFGRCKFDRCTEPNGRASGGNTHLYCCNGILTYEACGGIEPSPLPTPISCSLQNGSLIDVKLNTYCCNGKVSTTTCVQSQLSGLRGSCLSDNNCQAGLVCENRVCVSAPPRCTAGCFTANSCSDLNRLSRVGVCEDSQQVCCNTGSTGMACIPNTCDKGVWCGSNGEFTSTICQLGNNTCLSVKNNICEGHRVTPTPIVQYDQGSWCLSSQQCKDPLRCLYDLSSRTNTCQQVTSDPSARCYYGSSSCSSLNRRSANGCSACSYGGVCCGSVITAEEQKCVPRSKTCEGNGVKVCSEDGTHWLTSNCAIGLTCQNGTCVGEKNTCECTATVNHLDGQNSRVKITVGDSINVGNNNCNSCVPNSQGCQLFSGICGVSEMSASSGGAEDILAQIQAQFPNVTFLKQGSQLSYVEASSMQKWLNLLPHGYLDNRTIILGDTNSINGLAYVYSDTIYIGNPTCFGSSGEYTQNPDIPCGYGMSIAIHEVTHTHADEKVCSGASNTECKTQLELFNEAAAKDGVTFETETNVAKVQGYDFLLFNQYSTTDVEGHAISAAAYVLAGEQLKENMPNVYEYMKTNLFQGREYIEIPDEFCSGSEIVILDTFNEELGNQRRRECGG